MTDTKKKPKELSVEQLVIKDGVEKIAKRIGMLCRELEVDSLDLTMYSNAYARGGFPKTHIVQVTNRLEGYEKEIERIKKKWTEVVDVQQPN